jgi:uncharacterized protein
VTGRAELEGWLEAGAGGPERARHVHETPIAKVFVFADRVLKLKKPVDFGFLDFTTCEKRAWATRRELQFNKPLAPDVYRAVHAVVSTAGRFSLVDPERAEGDLIDHVLEMRPFETDHILANHPDQVDGDMAERLGREVARVQAQAPPTPDGRGAAALGYVLRSNASQLRSLRHALGEEAVERLIRDTQAAFEQAIPLLDARRDAGFVRRCHGDLHLGNIVVEDGRPILFDCIEFNDVLSEIDVGYDVAFLVMDLAFRGRGAAANRVLNTWLDEAGRTFGADRLAGLAALPLFQSVRAAVRAHVSGHGGELSAARRYVEAAQGHLEETEPRLFAIGGLSGSGKSTFARALAPRVGAAPGALVLRTDEIRKRLFGAAPTERLPRAAYAPEVSPRVYGLMREEARAALRAGMSVVLDAAFLKPGERADAEALATGTGVAFTGLWMQADEEVVRRRLRARTGDASDADESVLDRQLQGDLGEIRWRSIDTGDHSEAQVRSALA